LFLQLLMRLRLFLDYILLDRPIGFFCNDRDQYTRGFVMENPDNGSIVAEDRGEPTYRFNSELIMPIIAQGDPIGAVVVCGAESLEDADRKVAQSAAGVLARQMIQ